MTTPAPSDGFPASAGLFPSPGAVLAFLAAAVGARLADDATCRQGPEGRWLATVALPWQRVASLVWAAGGRAYAGSGTQWHSIPMPDGPPATGAAPLDVSTWPPVALAALLGHLPLRPAARRPLSSLDVVVPAALGRWALRRAVGLGLRPRLTAARRQPLVGDGPETGVFLLHLEAGRRALPWSLVYALSSLPYTTTARAVGTEAGRLLVDVRLRFPFAQSLLSGMVPAGEVWVLGGRDVGHGRLQLSGEAIDGSLLLRTAAAPAPAPPPDERRPTRPDPLAVSLVPNPDGMGRTDALLLDDAELGWLRPFLMTRPLGERTFLLPGDGRHLLLAPGGLTTLPFGLPLRRIGPGGLYLESGLAFYPPLPAAAREEIFGSGPTHCVAVGREGSFRYDVTTLLPAWTLWAGPAPEVRDGVSAAGEGLLGSLSAALQRREAAAAPPPEADRPGAAATRGRLLREAQQAELAGDLLTAAERLEAAGELGAAGRLYERAAAERQG